MNTLFLQCDVTDHTKLHTNDGVDRLSGCWMGCPCPCHGGSSRCTPDIVGQWPLALCFTEFLGGLAADRIQHSVICLSSNNPIFQRTAASLVTTVCIIPSLAFLLLAVFWAAIVFFYPMKKRLEYGRKRIVLSVMVLWYITSVPVMKSALSAQLCVDVHDSSDPEDDHTTSRWAMDTDLECFTGAHRSLVILILSFVAIVYGGLLVVFVMTLGASEGRLKNQSSWEYETVGFLYRGYVPGHRRYWEVVVIVRKVIVAFLAFCAYRFDSQLPIIGAAIFILLVMGAQICTMPYRKEFHELNKIELCSSFVSVLTILIAAMLRNERFPEDGKRLAVSILCLLLNVMTFLVFACTLGQYGIEYLNLMLEEEIDDYDSNAGNFQVLKAWLKHETSELLDFFKNGHTAAASTDTPDV